MAELEFDSAIAERVGRVLAGADARDSAEILLMRVLIEDPEPARIEPVLAALADQGDGRALRLRTLLRAHAAELEKAAAMIRAMPPNLHGASGDAVETARSFFDRAAAAAPEASGAFYSLGSAAILERATAELVDRLDRWDLVPPGARVLDLGCGIGRVAASLAPRVESVLGLDIAPNMVRAAEARCAAFANARFAVCDGRDLGFLPDQAFTLAVAVDSFPYIVQAGPALTERHIAEIGRVLLPRGTLAIFNYSYRGDAEADGAELSRLAARHGFRLTRAGTRDLDLWDGTTFLLEK